MERFKTFWLRFLTWALVKFYYPKTNKSWTIGIKPLFDNKWPCFILTMTPVMDPHWEEHAKETLRIFGEYIDEQEKKATKITTVPFKTLKGGKLLETKKELPNWADTPLVSVILVTHSGDLHLLNRAINSVLNQDMNLQEVELLIYFDGNPTVDELALISECTESDVMNAFYNAQFISATEKNGYYCVGRNRITPLAQGFYIYNMDADNEIAPNHLSGLLKAIRTPDEEDGFPHFVYSRRRYIVDEGVSNPPTEDGLESILREWVPENTKGIMGTPNGNFIDTGDMLIGKSTLYVLAELTGCMWNPQCRRFGDWDLVRRLVGIGARGRAVNQVTNLYHWTGSNLQMTRSLSDMVIIPQEVYDKMVAEGKIKEG